MTIIDTHTHFFDPTRPQGAPFPPPEIKQLYRPILPADFKAVAVPLGVTGTVVVEASEWVEDNQWILDLAANEPFIVGHVGNLTPGTPDFARNLDRFAANPLYRGIRPRELAVNELLQENRLADLARLAPKDLELDLPVVPQTMPSVALLAERLPDLRMVICHVGVVRIDGHTPDAAWTAAMQAAAQHPNVFCKVSAVAEFTVEKPAPEDIAYYTPTLDVLWNAFGEDRLIYGSDWPVLLLHADYAQELRIVTRYFETKGPEASEKFFWKNAKVAYKWVDRS